MRERGGQTEIETNQTYKEIETVRQMDRERERHIVKEDELERKQRNSYTQLERKSNICT